MSNLMKAGQFSLASALLGILFSGSVFANPDCSFDADLHPEGNVGYEVGELCPLIELKAQLGTELTLIDDNQGQCEVERVLLMPDARVMHLKFDISKGSQDLGASCKVLTAFADGRSRVIGIQQFAD